MSKTWYLGPAGDLRALECPDVGIDTTITRYGGVHRGLSGSSTVDVLGHRQAFTFNFSMMTPEEVDWLECLHLRIVPGPLFLLNPLRTNRFTLSASNCRVGFSGDPGIILSGGGYSYVIDAPSAVPNLRTATEWTGWADTNFLQFDQNQQVPVVPGDSLVMSVYARTPVVSRNISHTIRYFDKFGAFLSSSAPAVWALTSSWARTSITDTVPASAATAVLRTTVTGGTPGTAIRFAGAQAELTPITAWKPGGGAVVVNVDQLTYTSTLYPYLDLTLTLLEA